MIPFKVTAVLGAAVVMVALAWQGSSSIVRAVIPPDEIYISGTSLVAGQIQVAVSTGGSSQGDFSGDSITLTYNTSQLTFNSWDTTGSILGSSGQICLPVVFASGEDAVSCGGTAGGTSLPGLLNTIILTPNGAGCANIHILTRAEAGDTFGTQTNDASTGLPQNNTYGPDVGVDLTTGNSCVAAATDTPTVTATATITSTPQATVAATLTATPFGGLRTVTPTITPTETATAAPPATAVPGGNPPPTDSSPSPGGAPGGQSGGPGGTIRLPSTGSGDGSGRGGSLMLAIATAVAVGAMATTGAAGYLLWRRAPRRSRL